ncbi:MAG: DNA alkylation repair protein [Burkholderiales bacterium]|nr:DNA alkylation repair protein [Bacteroidia bacterium]
MISDLNKYTKEVDDALNRLSLKVDKARSERSKKYIGTNLHVLGLVAKKQTEAHKKGFSFYSTDPQKTFLIFNHIYTQSTVFETKNQAFIFLDKYAKHIPISTQLKTLPYWIKYVDNWAHSDGLSKYLTRLLENTDSQKAMLDILKKWNASKNLWERRQSLVALYYYARTKKEYISFEQTTNFIFPLLKDKEYFVQKAVGWTLRETYNVYPKQAYYFIEENIKSISPTAFTACLEKMTEKEKFTLKQKRKK